MKRIIRDRLLTPEEIAEDKKVREQITQELLELINQHHKRMVTTHDQKLQDIRDHPERHRHHSFEDLHRCCFVDGAIDLSLIDAHSQFINIGENGGHRCDVTSGPCACGAWH